MNRLRRMPLPISPPCLFCRTRPAGLPSYVAQTVRSASGGGRFSRSPASRKVLSGNVDRQFIEERKQLERKNILRGRGPHGAMNLKEARIYEAVPPPRSKAALRRASRGKSEDKDASKKIESPLYKALKMQTALSPVTYGRRTAIKSNIADITTFDQFPLLPVVRHSVFSQALPDLEDVTPTPIQRVAIPKLLEESDGQKKKARRGAEPEDPYDQYLLAAETGSGKTLAYLVPLIDSIKRTEAVDQEAEKREKEEKERELQVKLKSKIIDINIEPELPPMSNAARPRVIILVPTAELVTQISSKVKAFSHTVKFRSGGIHSNLTPRRIKSTLFNPAGIDILVTTPHLLASIAKTEPYVLSRVSHLVLDEADSLTDRSFLPTTEDIISKTSQTLKKLILCSATIPRSLDSLLRKRYPNIKRLTTPNLHAIPRRVQLGTVDIERDPYRGNRSLACADVIWSIGKGGSSEPAGPFASYTGPEVKKIIVFVNERDEANEVADFLKSKGIDAQALSRDSSTRQQEETLAEFTEVAPLPTTEEILKAQKERRQDHFIPFDMPKNTNENVNRLPNTKVLVTTDIASRGIDTVAAKTVILFHVPHTTIDFIHRLGRLGRMNRRGRGIVLVGKKDRKDVVREVREGMFRGQALV